MSQERAATGGNDWKEFTAPSGRKYYYNKSTKESRWTMPDELRAVMAAPPAQSGTAPPATAAPGPAAAAGSGPAAAAAPSVAPQAAKLNAKGANIAAGSYAVPASVIQTGPTPHYATSAEAKEAFKQLLTEVGISTSMTWDEAMRMIMQDRRCARKQAYRGMGVHEQITCNPPPQSHLPSAGMAR